MNEGIITDGLAVASLLFALGLTGVLVRRNVIFVLLSIEIMLNAAALAFIAAGSRWHSADGQVMYVFILSMAAAEVSVGLALVIQMHRVTGMLNLDGMKNLNG